jgi:hypothetical protein
MEVPTSKAFRDLGNAFWTPGSLGVDDGNSTLSTALFFR